MIFTLKYLHKVTCILRTFSCLWCTKW